MSRNLVVIFVLLVLCGLSERLSSMRRYAEPPFSIGGVSLGMTEQQVSDELGLPDISRDGALYFERGWDKFQVLLDSDRRVIGIAGTKLELNGVDYTPENSHRELADELMDFLGEPDWSSGEAGDFVHEVGYTHYHLVLQLGCTGWTFYLGQRESW